MPTKPQICACLHEDYIIAAKQSSSKNFVRKRDDATKKRRLSVLVLRQVATYATMPSENASRGKIEKSRHRFFLGGGFRLTHIIKNNLPSENCSAKLTLDFLVWKIFPIIVNRYSFVTRLALFSQAIPLQRCAT